MTTKEEKCHPKTGNTSFSPNLILFFFPLFPYIFFDIKIKKKKKLCLFIVVDVEEAEEQSVVAMKNLHALFL